MLYQTELQRHVEGEEGIEPPTHGLRARCSTPELLVRTVLSVTALAYGVGKAARTGRGATSIR